MSKPATKSMKPHTVDAYLAAQPAAVRAVLTKIRAAIRSALPAAEETISYAIPAYRNSERTVLYFAGWKQHVALYPASEALLNDFADELSGRVVSKGTIRFDLDAPVPIALIKKIAKRRAEEVAAKARG